MIRGFFRLIGLLLLAGGFVFLVYDGARSIADQAVRLTRLSRVGVWLLTVRPSSRSVA